MGDVTLLIGGARSGKSALAVEIGRRHDGDVVFVATAEPFDDDMRSRIARHRVDRPDWPVVEAPLDLGEAIAAAPSEALLLVDCLTVWVNNQLHHRGVVDAGGVANALVERSGSSVESPMKSDLVYIPRPSSDARTATNWAGSISRSRQYR